MRVVVVVTGRKEKKGRGKGREGEGRGGKKKGERRGGKEREEEKMREKMEGGTVMVCEAQVDDETEPLLIFCFSVQAQNGCVS